MPYDIYKLSNKAGSTIIAKFGLSCFGCCHIPEAHLEFTAEAHTFAKAQLSRDWFSLVHLSHGSNLQFSADLHLLVSLFVFLPRWGNILQYWVVKRTKIFKFTGFCWSYFYFCAVIYCNDWFISTSFGKMCTNAKHREDSIHHCMGIWHRSHVRQTIWISISVRKQSFSLIQAYIINLRRK